MSCLTTQALKDFLANLQTLNSSITEGDALAIYEIYNAQNNSEDQIPDTDTAFKILENLITFDKDEQLSRSSDEFKINKLEEQNQILGALRESIAANNYQAETLDKLIDMTSNHIDFINEGIASGVGAKTISVSKFIGNSTFKGDPTEYESFKLFGIFIHEVLENIQKEAIAQGNISNKKFYNRDLFNKYLAEYKVNNPFNIKGLTDDMLYTMTEDLVSQISVLKSSGYMIVPEVTVVGKDLYGTRIIGRIDMLLIDPLGAIKIYDFKTKKVQHLDDGSSDWQKDNADEAFAWLALKQHQMDQDIEGTNKSLVTGEFSKRSAYDTWAMQTNVYQNILEQNGLDVSGHSILALLYETDKNHNFLGSLMHLFDNENYYIYSDNKVAVDNDGVSVIKKRLLDQRVSKIKNLVDSVITGKTKKEPVVVKSTQIWSEIIQPSDKEYEAMRANLKALIDKQISEVNKLIYSKSTPLATKNIAQEKARVLLEFSNTLKRMSNEDIDRASNFAIVLDQVSSELSFLNENAKTLEKKFEANPNKFNASDLSRMDLIFRSSQGLIDTVKILQRTINEARDKEENNINDLSPAMILIGTMLEYIENIRRIKSEIQQEKAVAEILKTPGVKKFQRVNDQLKEVLGKEKEILLQEIESIKSGRGLSLYDRWYSKALSAMSSSYRSDLKEKIEASNTGEGAKIALIEEKEQKIKIIDSVLSGTFDFTQGKVLAYLNNITDPDSFFYVGSDRILPYTMLLSNSMTSQWIAGVSNSQLAVASITEAYKNAAATAVKNAQNDFASSNFDKKREQLYRQGMSFEAINSKITEKITVKKVNPETGLEEEVTELRLVTPYSQEYFEKFYSYRNYFKEFKSQRKILEASRTASNYKDVNKQIANLQNERAAKMKEYMTWMIQNCSLPYKDEFYELQRDLSVEIAEKLQDLYLELETLRLFENGKGKGNEAEDNIEILDGLDFDRIGEIEDEIRGLREKAKEIDPKYADYIDRINDFYEFVVDNNKFERAKIIAMATYENNEEAKQKWLNENQVTKPKKEWYDDLQNLYDQIAFYYPEDTILKDLYNERNKIIKKHRSTTGEFRSQYMSDVDLENYAAIEDAIDNYLANKKSEPIEDEDARDFLNTIFSEIRRIKERKLSDYYNREFSSRLEKLENNLNLISQLKNYLTSLEVQNADKDLINETKLKLEKEENHFYMYELEFEKWYNKHHVKKYKSITSGYKIASYATPKSFNYVSVPSEEVAEQYMETVPHPKYTVKRIKQDSYQLDGVVLTDIEREELNTDPELVQSLLNSGRLLIEKGMQNPNFLETPDGIPMPKNIMQIAPNVYAPIPGKGYNNINPKYLELYNNADIFELYNTLSSMFFRLQKKTDGKVLGYTVPGSVSGVVESLYKVGLAETIKKQKEIFVDKNIRSYGSAQDLNDNIFGDLNNKIRLKGNNQFDSLIQSEDAISSIMQWCAEAHYNIAMQEIAPLADGFIDELKSKKLELQEKITAKDKGIVRDVDGKVIKAVDFNKRLIQLNEVIEQAEYEKRKFVYGQYEDPNVSRSVTKKLNMFFQYTSFIRIGYDVTNQAKNYFSGTIQAWIAACNLDTGHYGSKDFYWSKGHLLSTVLPNYIKDLGNGSISDVSDTTMLYRLFNPAQKEFSKYVKDTSGKVSRKVLSKMLSVQELGFFLQDKGDSVIAMTVLWSVLNSYKYAHKTEKDADGNPVMIPAHQCYQRNDNNELVMRPDVEYTQEDENMLRNTVYSEMKRAQGNYYKADQVKAESHTYGKLMLFFKKYLLPMFMNRFGYMKTNWEAGEVALGYWRAVGLAIRQYGPMETAKHMLIGGKTLNRFNANVMGKFMTGKVNQARRDAIIMSLLTMASLMALSWLRKKKDEDEEYEPDLLTGNLLRLLWQVKGEATSMFPVGEGSDEYIKNFTTAIPFVREFTAAKKLVTHLYSTTAVKIVNDSIEPDEDLDSQWYQETWKNAYYARAYGSYEKGDSKLIKDFVDLTGIRNIRDLFEPTNRIQVLEQNQ